MLVSTWLLSPQHATKVVYVCVWSSFEEAGI